MHKKLLTLLISILSVVACTKDDGKVEIRLSDSAYSVGSEEGLVSIPYTLSGSSEAVDAKVEEGVSWLRIGGVSDRTVQVLVSANSDTEDRTAKVILSHKGAQSVSCHIVQKAYDAGKILLETEMLSFGASSGDATIKFQIISPSSYGPVLPDVKVTEGCDWLTVDVTSMESMDIHADANTGKERSAEITLSYDRAGSAKLLVVQDQFQAVSVIKLTDAVVSEDRSAHSFDVAYSISGKAEGKCAEVTMDPKQDWLRLTGVTASALSFDLDANTSEESRSTVVVLSCEGARDVQLNVIQDGNSQFHITVADVSQARATVTFSPEDPGMTYAYSVEKKALFDGYGSEAYIEAYVDSMLEMAEEQGVSLSDMLAKGQKKVSLDNLDDDTVYYALAFDLDADGKSSGKVSLLEFRTPKAVPSDNRISFEVAADGTVSVRTTNEDPYIFDVWDIESWEEMPSPEDLAKKFVTYMKGFEGAIQAYTHRGDYQENYTQWLTPGKNVAFAFGYKDGITTEVFYYVFDWKKQ